MKLRVTTLAAVCLLVSGIANAEEVKTDPGPSGPPFTPAADCDLGPNMYVGAGGPIPDCTPGGITFGPVMAPDDDGLCFESAVLQVELDHTWMGDLIVNLFYDVDCDGTPEVGPISALCRAGLDGCPEDDCCGCSNGIFGSYFFDDGGESLDDVCVGGFDPTPGCYGLDPDSTVPMASLNGVSKGGCFTLNVVDGACADTGFVFNWAVYTYKMGCSTPVDETSWSEIKNTF